MKERANRRKAKRHDDRADANADAVQPRDFKAHLLAIPQDGGEFERIEVEFRDIDFGEP